MAKCVELYRDGKKMPNIRRISDDEAQDLVNSGHARYIAKNAWKKERNGETK